MNSKFKTAIFTLVVVFFFATAACTASAQTLNSVKFEGTIASPDLNYFAFGASGRYEGYIGDLRVKYLAGGIGTYTRPSGSSYTWTKQ